MRELWIGSEGLLAAKRIDTAKQELQVTEGGTRSILRNHVPRQGDANIGETTLCVSSPKDACAGNGSKLTGRVIRNIEGLDGRLLKAKLAAKGHVLDSHERTVGQQNKVESAVANDDVFGLVDDIAEDGGAGRRGLVVIDEDGAAAGCPFPVQGRVDGLFHVLAVEVDGGALGQVVEAAGEAEDVPQQRAGCSYLVDVEAGVQVCDGLLDGIGKQVVVALWSRLAGVGVDAGQRVREVAGRRVAEVLAAGVGVSALVVDVVDLLGEGVVEREQAVVVVDKGYEGEFGDAVVGDGRVVDEHALHVEVLAVVGIDHGVGNVRAVHAAWRLLDVYTC